MSVDNVVHIHSKSGIFSTEKRPNKKDVLAADGILMYGYRKVREKDGIGYIHAHGMKFGCEQLFDHKGEWVLVDVSDYWAVTARIGAELIRDECIHYLGVKCKSIKD